MHLRYKLTLIVYGNTTIDLSLEGSKVIGYAVSNIVIYFS